MKMKNLSPQSTGTIVFMVMLMLILMIIIIMITKEPKDNNQNWLGSFLQSRNKRGTAEMPL